MMTDASHIINSPQCQKIIKKRISVARVCRVLNTGKRREDVTELIISSVGSNNGLKWHRLQSLEVGKL